MATGHEKRNVFVLAMCQIFFNSGRGLIIATSPLVGYAIAGNKALSTLPMSLMLVGNVVSAIPASLFMRRVGRRVGFVVGSAIGTLGAALAAWGVLTGSFPVFLAGIVGFGLYSGFGQFYRFAAADVASDGFKSTAISLVLAGGVVAAFVGPELSKLGRDLWTGAEFFGAYVFLAGLALLSGIMVLFVDIPKLNPEQARERGRPLAEIVGQPAFVVALLAGMLGYAVMSLLMTATPLAMMGHQHHFDRTAFVIEWHSFFMFAPGFFTGRLIRRHGTTGIIVTGLVLEILASVVAVTGATVGHYWMALALLGLGWNFAFTGATAMVTETHTASERAKVQGVNDFLVFGGVALASFSSGGIYHFYGWPAVNFAAVPLAVMPILAVVWLHLSRRRVHRPA